MYYTAANIYDQDLKSVITPIFQDGALINDANTRYGTTATNDTNATTQSDDNSFVASAKDPQNAYPGAVPCTDCHHFQCICAPEPEPEPELELIEPETVNAALEKLIDTPDTPLTIEALAILSQPGILDDNPEMKAILNAHFDSLLDNDNSEDSQETVDTLDFAAGQTSFEERIMNLIQNGHPEKAVDMLALAANFASEDKTERIERIAKEAYELLGDIGKYDNRYAFEANLLSTSLPFDVKPSNTLSAESTMNPNASENHSSAQTSAPTAPAPAGMAA